MKILFNNSIFFNQHYGGVSRYFSLIFQNLIKKDISFKVITPIYKNRYLKSLHKKHKSGLYIPRYPVNGFLKKFNESISLWLLEKEKSEIIHDTFYSGYLERIKNKKKIITVYDSIHEKFEKFYDTKKIISDRKKIFQNTDRIISISNTTKEDLIDIYKISEKKIHVTYLGSDHLDLIKINEKKINNVIQNKIFKPFLLYVGNRYRYKNYKTLINAYANSKMLKDNYQIIFFGGEKVSNSEKKLYENLNITGQVVHLGGGDDVLKYLYTKAIVLISTSVYEGFGINVLEAIRFGCKVLANDIKVFREIFKDKITYFNDENDLKSELENLSDHKKENYPNHKIIKEFNWLRTTEETLKVYDN